MPVKVRAQNDFPKIAALIPPKARRIENSTAIRIALGAERRSPFRTGGLRRSITVTKGVVTVGTQYSRYQEHGTRKMSAHPYLIPAVRAEVQRFARDLKSLLTKAARA